MKRRLLLGLPLLSLAGCATPDDPVADRWHMGQLFIGTGNPTGVFYEVGAAFAGVISRHLTGYDGSAAPTNGSIDNLRRLATGDVDLGLVFSDNAADALHGTGAFDKQAQPLRALARLYNNYVHVIVRTDSGINTVSEMRGHRVSTNTHGSGTEVIAGRMLTSAGLDPKKDVQAITMSLAESATALGAGHIDGMFWSGGLPTSAVSDLFRHAGGKVRFLPVAYLEESLAKLYGAGIYTATTLPKETYGSKTDVPTVAEPNLLVVSKKMPNQLAYQLTQLLFSYKSDLVAVNSAAKDIVRATGPKTEPVPLHDGAAKYYAGR
jgi:TRAP transporter TAXI family solute receptor